MTWVQITGKKEVKMEDFCAHLLHISTDAPSPSFTFNVKRIEAVGKALGEKYKWDFDAYAPRVDVARAQEIVKSAEFVQLKGKYASQNSERARYGPFVELVNYVLKQLRGDQKAEAADLVFARNDPQVLQGFQGEHRSPDLVGIRNRIATNRSTDWNTRGSNKAPFHCRELLFFVEFERESNQAQDTKTLSYVSTSQTASTGKRGASDDLDNLTAKRSKTLQQASSSRMISDSMQVGTSTSGTRASDMPQRGEAYRLKCADYAAGLFTFGGLRNFVFGMLINGSDLRLCCYGRSAIISTLGFNFLEESNSIKFVALLEGLTRLDEPNFGVNTALDMSNVLPEHFDAFGGAVLTLHVEGATYKITLADKVYIQQALLGRGSFIARSQQLDLHPTWIEKLHRLRRTMQGNVKVEFEDVSRVIVKLNSVPKTRTPEYQFIQHATEAAQCAGPRFLWVLFHLPVVFHWEDLETMDESSLRTAFMLATSIPDFEYEMRTSTVLVMENLHPITEIDTPYELLRAIRDCVQVHKWLVEDLDILHRDISLGNLMFRTVTVNGVERKYGVLNDFDLAVFTTRKKTVQGHKQRTGTPPFMARDLLRKDNKRHWPRYDLESIFYVHLWIVLGFHNGFQKDDHPLEQWSKSDFDTLYHLKNSFWADSDLPANCHFTGTFAILYDVTLELFQLLQTGFESWNAFRRPYLFKRASIDNLPRYNIKTLDGHVTHTKFIQILSDGLEWLEDKGHAEGYMVDEPHEVQYGKGGDGYDEQDWDPENDAIVRAVIVKSRERPTTTILPLPKATRVQKLKSTESGGSARS